MYINILSIMVIYILLCFPAEVESTPTCGKCELNFIVTIILSSSTATVLFIVIIIGSLSVIVKRMILRRHNQNNKEHKTADNIVYEDIELHQPSLSYCDTTDNVAYSHTSSCKWGLTLPLASTQTLTQHIIIILQYPSPYLVNAQILINHHTVIVNFKIN